jgi:hypothetical protein
MSRAYIAVEDLRRCSNRARAYRWEAEDPGRDPGRVGAPSGAADGWVLVRACADGYQETNPYMEVKSCCLFFARETG